MCGVLGVYASRPSLLYDILNKGTVLNERRGPDSFGISMIDPAFGNIYTTQYVKDKGAETLDEEKRKNSHYHKVRDYIMATKSRMAISQTRYSTDERTTEDSHDAKQLAMANTQPIQVTYREPFRDRGIGAQNGNVPPIEKQRLEDLVHEKSNHKATVDTRAYTELYMQKLREYNRDYFKAAEWMIRNVRGTSSFIFSDGHNLIAYKDQYTNRPLCFMGNDQTKVISSESNISTLRGDLEFYRELELGEILKVDENGEVETRNIGSIDTPCGLCKLEPIYLMDYRSLGFDGSCSVDSFRFEYGASFVRLYPELFQGLDVLAAVPESGNSYTRGVSFEARIPMKKPISKPDKKRNFLEGRNGIDRMVNTADHKFCFQAIDIQDKDMGLIDDSLIRGDTLATTYIGLQMMGAKRVRFFSMWPVNPFRCDKGTDTQTNKELAAYELVKNGTIHLVDEERPEQGYTYDQDDVNKEMTRIIRSNVRTKAEEMGVEVDPKNLEVYFSPISLLNSMVPEGCTTCLNKVELKGWKG